VRRFLTICAVLLLLAAGGRASLAQVATPQAAEEGRNGAAPLPLTGELRAEFETYVASRMAELGVPGAAVAVVQGGEIVYAQGFGVREIGGTQPVTPDTLMMIGSINKSMTSLMAATLVDDGWLSWQTPVVELLPEFAVADPELTARLTVADAFCACTGLPQRDAELVFNSDSLTPERLIASVADFPLTAPLGERFQYSNQMYAIGGYAAAVAAGATPSELSRGYVAAMRDRVLNPIGMTRSTFALDDVLGSGDYAQPHVTDLDGTTRVFPLLVDEQFVTAAGPAGELWSTARDMARYVQTELAHGVAPDGARVASEENLTRTWQPGVAPPSGEDLPPLLTEAGQNYGLGWVTGAYKGHRLLWHNGGTFGFASTLAFLPDDDLGVVVLTNSIQTGELFATSVQYRLLELLFGQPAEIDPLLEEFFVGYQSGLAEFQTLLGDVDPATVVPYLGRYSNPALGEVDLALRDGQLIFDIGELQTELRPLLDESSHPVGYVMVDAPLAGPTPLLLQETAGGRPEIVATIEGDDTATYVFTFNEPAGAATPAAAG
jgi:CubicO group peptidase (beta-lactamase class C family)